MSLQVGPGWIWHAGRPNRDPSNEVFKSVFGLTGLKDDGAQVEINSADAGEDGPYCDTKQELGRPRP